jgi:hypothetical protein
MVRDKVVNYDDLKAGSIMNMFNSTTNHHAAKLFLDNSTGVEK